MCSSSLFLKQFLPSSGIALNYARVSKQDPAAGSSGGDQRVLAAYVNQKRFYSILLQSAVDSRMLFTDCYGGWLGSVHDARFFFNSPLYNFGAFVCKPDLFIVGDAAYPLMIWLHVPYIVVMGN
jgi:hypothetical protein